MSDLMLYAIGGGEPLVHRRKGNQPEPWRIARARAATSPVNVKGDARIYRASRRCNPKAIPLTSSRVIVRAELL